MPSFSLTPIDPFPPTAGPFPSGTQFQDELVNVGPPEPKFVNFTGPGVQATYDNSEGRVNVFVSQTGGTQFQDEGVNVGGPAPSFVNFVGSGVSASYTPSSDTVLVDIQGGGGGGGTPIFYATRGSTDQTSGSIFIYENTDVFSSLPGTYNPSDGRFTASLSGAYSFSASAVIKRVGAGSGVKVYYVYLIKNYENIISYGTMVDTGPEGENVFAGSVCVSALRMSPGDVVQIELGEQNAGFYRLFMSSSFFMLADAILPLEGIGSASHFSGMYHPIV